MACVLWLIAAGSGLFVVWAYDNRPGAAAEARPQWPGGDVLPRDTTRPTLVMLAHPQCSCTRASMGELAEVLARTTNRPKTYVVFLRPSGVRDGWEQTELWQTAAQLPDVTVVRDVEGAIAQRFGAITSGQTFVYDRHGALIFSGGITGSRGHAGDNAGRAALLRALHQSADHQHRLASLVFGCPLVKEDAAP